MNGLIALVGSGEYLSVMNEVDRYLLDSLDTKPPRVVCLPTAAGQEGEESVNRWSRMGVEHFQKLGAEVEALPIVDKASANDEKFVPKLENANFIYLSGGNPMHLYETMRGSLAWGAMQKAWGNGAIYAGCSAGAMILSKRIPSFRLAGTNEGFGIVPSHFIIPHFDAIPGLWKPLVFALKTQLKKGERMIGVDENTALVGRLGGEWKVMGKSKVHVFTRDGSKTYSTGQTLLLH
ncbi:MAG TPA: Type 1 glutamine amidotransferase-like domain-containing protein [Anaerolineales bacterium]|nr:Type 1 glutamine amidotransferase-like domain-containing protein [Anaerolineales bacterium]